MRVLARMRSLFSHRRRWLTALGAAACVAIAAVVVAVDDGDGYPTRHVDLGDGGVWSVSEYDGQLGRVNLATRGLDAAFAPPGGGAANAQLDVSQDAVAVLARDRAAGRLYPVDAAAGRIDPDAAVSVSATAQVAMAGGTLALLDPVSGKVWGRRYGPAAGLTNLSGLGGKSAPVALLGAGSATAAAGAAPGTATAAVTVAADGAIYALSASGKLATVTVDGSGLSTPSYRNLGARLRAPQLTAVGNEVVVLDAATGAMVLPDGRSATLPDRDPATELQQASADGTEVLAATSRGLYAVPLGGEGEPRRLDSEGTGTPSAPLVVGSCGYAVWSGTPGRAVRSCDGGPATVVTLADQKALVQPQLRVNRGAAVLNDVVSGGVWALPSGVRVDNWRKIKPPVEAKPQKRRNDDSDDVGRVNAPPRAVADRLGARPGRATTLHVLDNDSDPAGSILSITSAVLTDSSGADLAVAPDGQTVQLKMPASVSSVRFRYTVNDTKNLSASANVVVTARPAGTEQPPNLRPGFQPRTWAVAAGGKISLPVIGDWRDFDGDVPVLASTTISDGSASTTPDGRVNVIAPLAAGTVTMTYGVTDGLRTQRATVNLNVLGLAASDTSPAVANPDVVRGQVGQPIVIRPLDNDLPGADPTDPSATLSLASDVPEPDGTRIVTDRDEGTATVTAQRTGTVVLSYLAGFGNAGYARGSIRVDVNPPPTGSEKPVAVVDTATVRGQNPVISDVLTNDFDPAGRVLVVTSAAAQDPSQLQVAIVAGKYLRINALKPDLDPNPQVVDYTITDGVAGSVRGQVVVGQLPEVDDGTPVPQDDYGIVRAGDSVTVPVLDNDTDPNGDTLSLVPAVKDAPAPGRLTVTGTSGGPAGGYAYAADSVVRYVAPTSGVTTDREVTVEYVVRNNRGEQAVGKLFLTVTPLPSATRPNKAPTPPEIDLRVVAGDSVTVPVRASLVDPDGDAVSLVGIGSGPQLGRVLGLTPSSLRYQAYPTSSGTDSFSYTVTDRFGRTGTAALRIAVVGPGDPQQPVASDITIGAAPGATVTVDVLSRAFFGPGDKVSIVPLADTNSRVPTGAKLVSPTGPVRVTASNDLRPVVVRYAIRNGLSQPSTATLRVRTVAGIDLPPVAIDKVATPAAGRDVVTVDALAGATDPDGDPARPTLKVTRVFDRNGSIGNGKITLPVLARPQVVPFEIADAGGAAATAVVYVPARGDGPPAARAGASIDLDENATKSIDIADYAVDPKGGALQLTTADQVTASPAQGLRIRQQSSTQLVVTAQRDYVGPAAITFQVTNGSSLTDPDGDFGVITVPVQVGPETPVLRCPTGAVGVVEGGATVDLDVAGLCHVWVANPDTIADVRYTASWSQDPDSISLGGYGTRVLHVAAAGGAKPNSAGVLKIGVVGSDAKPSSLRVTVQASPPPTVSPVTVDGLVAGRSTSVDLADYVESRLRDKVVSIVGIDKISGLAVTYPISGSRVTLTPGPDAKGTIVLAVTVSDVAQTTIGRRQATGRITINVLGRPDPPTGIAPGRTVLSHTAVLSWRTPDSNGEPIDYYELSWDGGRRNCPGSPCTVRGLTNGQQYRFTVRAHNAVGFGKSSPQSAVVEPNEVPAAATGLRTSNPQDHKLTVSWRPAKVDGTPVLYYLLRHPGARAVKTSGTSATATGLDNNARTRFQVVAVNKLGAGPAASVTGQSAGTPQFPAPPADPQRLPAPRLDAKQLGDHQAVGISWPAINPNGPGPVTYRVVRKGGDRGSGDREVCRTKSRSCTDGDVTNDGNQYDYVYTATNDAGKRSGQSAGASFVARGKPEGVEIRKFEGLGQDGRARLEFRERPVRDRKSVVYCRAESENGSSSCGRFEFTGANGHDYGGDLSGLPSGQVTITLTQCNTVGDCAPPAKDTDRILGPISQPRIENARASGPNINFDVVYNPHGAAVEVTVKVRKDNGDPVYEKTFSPDETDNRDQTLRFTDAEDGGLGTPISAGSTTGVVISVTVRDQQNIGRSERSTENDDVQTGFVKVTLVNAKGCPADQTNCGDPKVQLLGFQKDGNVLCTFDAVGGTPPGPIRIPTDGNGNGEGPGSRFTGTSLKVTCEAVIDGPIPW